MPRQRNFDSLYKSLNIHREKETPRIPETEKPSNNLSQSYHSMCDFLFEEYSDGKGLFIWKSKRKRITDDELKQLREMLMEYRGEV